MSQKAKTPDERFLIELHRIVQVDGDGPVEWLRVATLIGQTERSVRNIVKLLAQANFIKKVGDTEVRLTPHGSNFVLSEYAFTGVN
jgi:Mn-dependent DtxR family transcriptional regulator